MATGSQTLQLEGGFTATATAFSPDGKLIALSGDGAVKIYELSSGRGFQTLWGLEAPIEKSIISGNNRFVAALTQDFRLAVWDRSASRLLHVLEVPVGVFADNAGLAFSPDGLRLAYAAGTQARLWEVESGQILKSWTLPEGFQDNLAFLDDGRLISARVETTDPRVPPYGVVSRNHARVVRIRNLNPDVPQILTEISDFNLHVFHSELACDGRTLMIEGRRFPHGAGANREGV